MTAGDVLTVCANHIHRGPASRTGQIDRPIVLLEASDSQAPPGRVEGQVIANPQRTPDQGSGDHCSKPRHRKRPVHRQAWPAGVWPGRGAGQLLIEGILQLIQARPAESGHRDDGGGSEGGLAHHPMHFVGHQAQPVGIHEVCLGQGDHPVSHAEQVEDGQMFVGLRHRTLIGCHHEEHGVDAVNSGQHVLEESLVPGHVDDAQVASAGQVHVSKAEIDGHPSALLLFQAVGVDAGQGLDQARLAMIDVAGGADDEGSGRLQRVHRTAAITAWSSLSSSSGSTVRGSSTTRSSSIRAITGGD